MEAPESDILVLGGATGKAWVRILARDLALDWRHAARGKWCCIRVGRLSLSTGDLLLPKKVIDCHVTLGYWARGDAAPWGQAFAKAAGKLAEHGELQFYVAENLEAQSESSVRYHPKNCMILSFAVNSPGGRVLESLSSSLTSNSKREQLDRRGMSPPNPVFHMSFWRL